MCDGLSVCVSMCLCLYFATCVYVCSALFVVYIFLYPIATIPLNYTYTWCSAVKNSVTACISVARLLHRERRICLSDNLVTCIVPNLFCWGKGLTSKP